MPSRQLKVEGNGYNNRSVAASSIERVVGILTAAQVTVRFTMATRSGNYATKICDSACLVHVSFEKIVSKLNRIVAGGLQKSIVPDD